MTVRDTSLSAALLALSLVATAALAGDEKQAPKLPPTKSPPPAAKAVVEDTGVLGSNDGRQVYAQICQGCHMHDGRGAVGAGSYPAFAGNPAIASAPYMVVTILNGRRNMPAFDRSRAAGDFFPAVYLTDTQVANVVNYVRSNFGNTYPERITADDVAKLKPKPEPKP